MVMCHGNMRDDANDCLVGRCEMGRPELMRREEGGGGAMTRKVLLDTAYLPGNTDSQVEHCLSQ